MNEEGERAAALPLENAPGHDWVRRSGTVAASDKSVSRSAPTRRRRVSFFEKADFPTLPFIFCVPGGGIGPVG